MPTNNSSSTLLEKLIAYPTVSRDSNLQLIDFIRQFLSQRGIDSTLTHNDERTKANLYATVGPSDKSGVMLSGHTDVVPTEGQNWSTDPFIMDTRSGRHYGRGTADMKGFIACVLSLLDRLDPGKLKTPIHLAFSYDEEIGCVGVRRMIDMLQTAEIKPRFCIVGEPTSMQVAIAHKGKNAGLVNCHGVECHSSMAPMGLNAIHLAAQAVNAFRDEQQRLIEHAAHDPHYDVSHTTLHIGVIEGGTALNIVPNQCQMQFEIRNLPDDNPDEILASLRARCDAIAATFHDQFPVAAIQIDFTNRYPALDTSSDSEVVKFVRSLTGANSLTKLAFGTEGGLFTERLGIETVVIGPGSIEQAHKPDEYIEQAELQRCDVFLDRLVEALC